MINRNPRQKLAGVFCYTCNMAVFEDKCVIYGLWCLCHPEDGIRYVGQTTVGAWSRLGQHLSMLRYNLEHNKRLTYCQNWILKHGPDNIAVSVIDIAPTPDDLDTLEEFWIKQFDNLTNIRTGGAQSRGWKMPEGFAEARTGSNNPSWGKDRKAIMAYAKSFQTEFSAETRRKLSESHTGLTHTPETRRKMSESAKASWTPERRAAQGEARSGENHPLYGVGHSEETKRKMSMSKTKLTEDDIRRIRRMRESGMKHKEIIATFPPGVLNESTCIKICQRKRFGWVED